MRKAEQGARVARDATLTSKGQLTLPAPVRDAMGVKSGDKVRFQQTSGDAFIVTPVRRGDLLALAGIFANAGKRVGDMNISEMRRKAWSRRGKKLRSRR